MSPNPPRDITGLCFDIKRYAIHDGPGLRTSVFLKGCPLRCVWCHNPEGQRGESELFFFDKRCIECDACGQACAHQTPSAVDLREGALPVACSRCGECVDACAAEARQLVGQSLTVDQLVETVERERPFFEQSGGGVTFTGGEPLMQSEFLVACLRSLRQRNIHTAVDTSGFAPTEVIAEVADWTDLFLYDLKVMDEAAHERYTGVPLGQILKNLREIDRLGATVWIRVPFILGINDDVEQLRAIGRIAASLERVPRVYLLPFHKLATDKYRQHRREYPAETIESPSARDLEKAASLLAEFGLETYVNGKGTP